MFLKYRALFKEQEGLKDHLQDTADEIEENV